MMLGKLINVETDELVTWEKFPDEEALAAENEQAQAVTEGRLSWEQLTPEEQAAELGWMLAVLGGLE